MRYVYLGDAMTDPSPSEGTVTFVEEFSRKRITFERDPFVMAYLWQATASGVSAPHVVAAYRWVEAVFGDSFSHAGVRS